jgi:ribosome-associated protein
MKPGVDLIIAPGISLGEEDLRFEYSRSSGPGGQNVNKVNTRATVCFDLERSRALAVEQKAVVRAALVGRISRSGVLRVTSRRHRSRAANERAALQRLAELLSDALAPVRPRLATRTPGSARRRRRHDKEQRSQVKRQRRRPDVVD